MFFAYKSNKYCINCDWLQYSVHLHESEPEILCPDGLRIEICQGNNIFEHRALVFDQRGGKYLTLLWKPYSKVLPANLMTVQVANEYLYSTNYLYQGHGHGILQSFNDLQNIVDCTFNAVGRVDLCCDFEGTEKRTEFVRHLNSNHYYVQAKSEGSSWWHEANSGEKKIKQLHCLTWGSAKSEIKVKLYHKSREQGMTTPEAVAEKPWIIEEWKEAGLDPCKMWRLEFSLSGAGQLRYNKQPITLENIADPQWLLNTYCELYASRFVTRINQGKRQGHENKDAQVHLIELPASAKGLSWAEPKGKDYELPASITLLRAMMRQIDNPAIMSARPTFNDYATTILNIIDNYHLSGYFTRTYEREPSEYFEELWTHVGQGIRTAPASPRMLMD